MATPACVQHVVWNGNGNEVGNAFKLTLPNATLASNCLLLVIAVPSTATLSSITDNVSNTWSTTPLVTVTDSANSVTTAIYGLFGATAGVTTITVTFSATVQGFLSAFSEWYNIATSAAADGHNSIAQNITGGAVVSGSFNTTADGDLIIHVGYDTDFGSANANGFQDGFSKVAKATGFTLLQVHMNQGYFLEYQVQGTHGATNPSATVTCTATPLDWSSLTVALKSASAGTAPSPTALRIFSIEHFQTGSVTGGVSGTGTWTNQMPTVGNLQAMLFSDPASSIKVTGVTDTSSNSWTAYSPDPGCPSAAYTTSSTATSDNSLSITISDATVHGYIAGCFYDIVNGGAHDTNAFVANGSFPAGNTPNSPSITPGVSHGVMLNCVGLATGPPNSLVTPTGANGGVFVSTFYTGETDLSSMDNGDCHGFCIFTSAATQNWVYHDTAASADANGIAMSFAAAVSDVLAAQILF